MLKQQILETALLPSQAALFYLGQEGFLIKFREQYILIDGYLTDAIDRGSPAWRRAYPSPLAPESLDFLDFVFCSHIHDDHADPETLRAICAVNQKAVFVVSAAIADAIAEMDIPKERILPMYTDCPTQIGGFSVTAVPAAHETLHKTAENCYAEIGFLFTFGTHTVYHAGDCCLYDGLADRICGAEVAMLPINGRDYYRARANIIGNFDCAEAVTLAKQIGASLLIPMHFDLYPNNGESPARFVDCVERIDAGRAYHIFAPGEKYILG